MSSQIGEVLAALGTCFDSLGVRWYLFGAQAAIFHGVARLTADVDVTVLPEPHSTGRLASVMEANGFRLRVTATDDFVARTRVLPFVHSATRLPVDVVLAGPGIEEQFLDRAEMRSRGAGQCPDCSRIDLRPVPDRPGPRAATCQRRHVEAMPRRRSGRAIQQFMDNDGFKRWMTDTVFELTSEQADAARATAAEGSGILTVG